MTVGLYPQYNAKEIIIIGIKEYITVKNIIMYDNFWRKVWKILQVQYES